MTHVLLYRVPDRAPLLTERRILQHLATLGPYATVTKRAINRHVQRSDVGASATYAALGRLGKRHLVVEARPGVYKITQAGLAAVALDEELGGGAA